MKKCHVMHHTDCEVDPFKPTESEISNYLKKPTTEDVNTDVISNDEVAKNHYYCYISSFADLFFFLIACGNLLSAHLGVESTLTCSTIGGSEDLSLRALTRSSSSKQPLTNSSSVTSPDSQRMIYFIIL